MITHYDLFAGIGGFSLALEEVFDEPIRHVFCEWESFPTAVLKQHWPDGEFWGDIGDLVTYTSSQRRTRPRDKTQGQHGQLDRPREDKSFTILTGGFPCQPFSAAGRRRGTSDDRYQWPEMYEVIRNTKPDWVIAENVRGLVTWNEGMVLEQVCSDLESEGYEVQPFIIPAVAKNAPHRRDRVWIIAHSINNRQGREKPEVTRPSDSIQEVYRPEDSTTRQSKRTASHRLNNRHEYPDWERSWQEVAFATCYDGVDDGLPRTVDGVPYSAAKWRRDSLKAYGNAIVPQVAIEIMKAIKEAQYS